MQKYANPKQHTNQNLEKNTDVAYPHEKSYFCTLYTNPLAMKRFTIAALLCVCAAVAGAQDIIATAQPTGEGPTPALQPYPEGTATAEAMLPDAAPLLPLAELTYGYLSYSEALQALPDYPAAQAEIERLRANCEAELQHNQEQFSKAYYDYIEGQQTFDEYILLKRQKELEQQLAANEQFKAEALQLLADKEKAVMQPLREQLATIINRIGMEHNYAFVLNIDNNNYLFINGAIGTDITADVIAAF